MHIVRTNRPRLHLKDSVICSRDAGAATPLVVDGGLARLCLYLPDGQRVVAGFAFAGEVVGLAQPQPSMVVEAVTTTWTHEWSNGDDAVAIDEAQMLSAALSRAMAVSAPRATLRRSVAAHSVPALPSRVPNRATQRATGVLVEDANAAGVAGSAALSAIPVRTSRLTPSCGSRTGRLVA